MVTFDPNSIKIDFMNALRSHIYPYQVTHSSSISLLSNGTITQTFYPFASSINTVGLYIDSKLGNPGNITLKVYNGTSLIKSGTLASTIGWNYLSVNSGDIITNRQSSLVTTANVTAGNDWFIGSNTLSSYYFGNAGTIQTAFTIGVKDFIYPVFPTKQLDNNEFPVISIDISGRPRIRDKYLSGDHVWYYLNMRAEIFSKFTNEVEKLIHGCDRGILNDRLSITNITYITPGQLSELSFVRPDVYYRNINWTLRSLISRE